MAGNQSAQPIMYQSLIQIGGQVGDQQRTNHTGDQWYRKFLQALNDTATFCLMTHGQTLLLSLDFVGVKNGKRLVP